MMDTDLDKNVAYVRDLYKNDPQGFADLTAQVKAMEPVIKEVLRAGGALSMMKAPEPQPLDAQTYEELEELSIELDNVASRVRELLKVRRGDLTAGLILENLKAASRHLQDAADNLIEFPGGAL